MLALICIAVASLRHPALSLAYIRNNRGTAVARASSAAASEMAVDQSESQPPIVPTSPTEIKWQEALIARGVELRVGEAIRWVLDKERDAPLAAILIDRRTT